MKTIDPIQLRAHDKLIASQHNDLKTSVTAEMQSFIDNALKSKSRLLKIPLNEYWQYTSALESKNKSKIADATYSYLADAYPKSQGLKPPATGKDGEVTFTGENYQYQMPGVYSPCLLFDIQSGWGNGLSKQPEGGKGLSYNRINQSIQQMVMDKRNEILSNKKLREAFIEKLENLNIDKTDPLYLCQKFILNPNTIEGIHVPPLFPPVLKAEIREGTAEYKAFISKTWANIKSLPSTAIPPQLPNPEPLPEQKPEPAPVPQSAVPIPQSAVPIPQSEIPNPKSVIPASQTIHIIDYSEKAIAVFGSTRQFKDEFLKIWGRWIPATNPATGIKSKAWIFSRKRKAQVEQIIKAA